MFNAAITLAIIALIASIFGFGGIAGLTASIAYYLIVASIILFIVAFFVRKTK